MDDSQAILKETRSLLAKGWYQGFLARTSSGREVFPQDREATQFCILGAIGRAEYNLGVSCRVGDVCERFVIEHGNIPRFGSVYRTLTSWNDAPTTTQQDVLDAVDRAIAFVEAP